MDLQSRHLRCERESLFGDFCNVTLKNQKKHLPPGVLWQNGPQSTKKQDKLTNLTWFKAPPPQTKHLSIPTNNLTTQKNFPLKFTPNSDSNLLGVCIRPGQPTAQFAPEKTECLEDDL